MIHQFVIEQYTSDDEWKTIIDTREFLSQTYYKPPYIALQIQSQMGVSTQAVLMIGNPDADSISKVVGSPLRIKIGYAYFDGNEWTSSVWDVFTGVSIQPPHFTEGGEGTDRILVIPLILYGFRTKSGVIDSNITLGDLLSSVLQSTTSESYEITYQGENSASLPKRRITGRFKTTNATFKDLVLFLDKEGYELRANDTGTGVFVKEKTATSNNSDKNIPVIYNSSDESGVATLLKTKYALLGLANEVSLELAVVMPQLLSHTRCKIENLGKNIIIYARQSKDGKTITTDSATGVFTILKQEVFFSTWGDCSHKVQLLADVETTTREV